MVKVLLLTYTWLCLNTSGLLLAETYQAFKEPNTSSAGSAVCIASVWIVLVFFPSWAVKRARKVEIEEYLAELLHQKK